jgi:hypothetical protein
MAIFWRRMLGWLPLQERTFVQAGPESWRKVFYTPGK